MLESLSAQNYRRIADEYLRDAKKTRFRDVSAAYEKLAGDWLKLAEESDRYYHERGGPPK
jgi:hypothetical protein